MKKTLKYQLQDLKLSIILFFLIYLTLFVFLSISLSAFTTSDSTGNNTISSMDVATTIFTLILGFAIFKEYYWMAAQNGVSRKTFFKSSVYCILITDAILTVLSYISFVMLNLIFKTAVLSQFELSYPTFEHNVFVTGITMILFIFVTYNMFFMFGFFISVLFYRASKIGKITIAAGLPILIFFLLPISVSFIPGFWKKVIEFVLAVSGVASGNPYYGIVTYTIITIIFGLLSYPLVKKAEI